MSEYDLASHVLIGMVNQHLEQSQRLADIESEFTTQTKNEKGQTVTVTVLLRLTVNSELAQVSLQ